jgi:hypothetical protein
MSRFRKLPTVIWLAIAIGGVRLSLAQTLAGGFHPPVRLQADGKPIDVDIGHAAPYLYDFNRDGKRDLLVGQFGEGKLRIYRNLGSDAEPKYGAFEWFMADGKVVTTPVG